MLVVLHGLTLFVGAFLLFWIQPLVARMLLPLLGGVPSVWNTSMLFFQAALLGGYLWAHLISRFRRSLQALGQGALLGLSLLFLPVAVDPSLAPPVEGGLAGWLLLALTAAVGLPTVALAGTAPLLQGWFSRIAHPEAEDPYFLYGASNLGSMAALVAYPLAAEPLLSLGQQARAWSAGFLLLAGLTLLAGLAPAAGAAAVAESPGTSSGESAGPPAGLQVRWLVLAFAPSSLLLGVTTHLTTDIASVPLLWVVPLLLYLLTYVMAFSRRELIPGRWLLRTQALAVVPLAVIFAGAVPRVERAAALLPLHLAAFFLTALVCHRELARLRPPAKHLTRYYLILSTGGVLGGVFNALLAPYLFRSLLEYQIVLVGACLLRPGREGKRALDGAAAILLLVALVAAGLLTRHSPDARWLVLGAGGVACLLLSRRPLRFGLALAVLVLAGRLTHEPLGSTLAAGRNFFGPVEVIGDARARILYHGRTIHGAQIIGEPYRRVPLAYYTTSGPLGDVFRSLAERLERGRVAVVGLGAGALAAYGQPGQRIVFYEINPVVAAMAADPRLFTYLTDSRASIEVRLGDGRLGLAKETDGSFGLVVVDAFNSDAVPVHLLTREAVDLYLDKLAPGGLLLFNLTNDYLDLEAVVGRVAAERGLPALVRTDDSPAAPGEDIPFKLPSDWLALGRAAADLEGLSPEAGWRPPRFSGAGRPWTDDHSSLAGAFRGP